MRTAFLIDGFNFYHSLENFDRCLRWFDYRKYCNNFLSINDIAVKIIYFTALAYWRIDSQKRHNIFIEATKNSNIDVVLGYFKTKNRICPKCNTIYKSHEEKTTDVNLALHAYQLARKDNIEQIILVTGDADFSPAIKMIKTDFPSVKIGIIFPYGRVNDELRHLSDFYHSTSKSLLYNCQVPDIITLQN